MKHQVKILDGGMIFELAKHYHDFGEKAMLEDNDLVLDLHKAYLDMGCSYITSASYGFKPIRQGDDWTKYIKISGELIHRLKDTYEFTALGCVPPYYESYFDGEADEAFKNYYKKLVEVLYPYVDSFIIETCVSPVHVEEISKVISEYSDTPFIVSSYPLGNIRREHFLDMITKYKKLEGVMVNCSGLSDVLPYFFEHIADLDAPNIIKGFYANKIDEKKYKASGTGAEKIQDLASDKFIIDEIISKEDYADFFSKYHAENSLLLGGCCGYGIEEMKQLIQNLQESDGADVRV